MTLNGPKQGAYAARRSTLRTRLAGAVLFVPAHPETFYSNDVAYPYRADSNLRYLSGFEEPAALILSQHGGDEDGFTLLVRPRDRQSETWTGTRAGTEDAVEVFGADHAYDIDRTYEILLAHLKRADRLYYAYSRDSSINQRVFDVVRTANGERPRDGRPPIVVADAVELLGEMRRIKRPEEIVLMREAARVSAAAHRQIVKTLEPGWLEYQVQADIDCAFRRTGCAGPAYETIAAGGERATVLHYTKNDRKLSDGELVLIDAGGEYGGYAADITRTIPVGRTYTTAQAALYEVVLEAQTRAIEAVRPGATLAQIHRHAVEALCEGLVTLGLLDGSPTECVEKESYKPYYMHNTSHWLGMDVHDVGSYKVDGESRPLEPGAVFTVEPGLYVRPDAEVNERYRGIGIRIEDDLLVTADSCEVLTGDAPKIRSEIEALRETALAG